MTRELEFGLIDLTDTRIPYWLRWISAIDRVEPGVPLRWPSDTKREYLVPVESRPLGDVWTLDFLRTRVREVLLEVEKAEPDPERVEQRAQEMYATGDLMVVHFHPDEPMLRPEGSWQDRAREGFVSAGAPGSLAAEERERAAQIRKMLEGRR